MSILLILLSPGPGCYSGEGLPTKAERRRSTDDGRAGEGLPMMAGPEKVSRRRPGRRRSADEGVVELGGEGVDVAL
jgi:hypothetical protein